MAPTREGIPMAYQKKSPEDVYAARMRAVAAMHEARAKKHAASVAAGTAGRKTLKQRGRTTIEVYIEDAREIAEQARNANLSRAEVVRRLLNLTSLMSGGIGPGDE